MSTPTIYANLENLAGDCGMHRETLRKYLAEISKAGLFRFDTPPYWRRKSGYATEISFPTKMVEKWLRDNGFLKTMTKNAAWSKHEKVNKTGVSTSAKLQKTPSTMAKNAATYHKSEGASPPAALTAAASRQEPKAIARHHAIGDVMASPKFGKGPIVEIEEDEDGLKYWIDFDRQGCAIEIRTGSPSFASLSRYDGEDEQPEPPAGNECADTPSIPSPPIQPNTPEPVPARWGAAGAHQYRGGERVLNLRLGAGTAQGTDGNLVLVAFDNGVTKKVPAAFLELIA